MFCVGSIKAAAFDDVMPRSREEIDAKKKKKKRFVFCCLLLFVFCCLLLFVFFLSLFCMTHACSMFTYTDLLIDIYRVHCLSAADSTPVSREKSAVSLAELYAQVSV